MYSIYQLTSRPWSIQYVYVAMMMAPQISYQREIERGKKELGLYCVLGEADFQKSISGMKI
jgi:hypothetical protein